MLLVNVQDYSLGTLLWKVYMYVSCTLCNACMKWTLAKYLVSTIWNICCWNQLIGKYLKRFETIFRKENFIHPRQLLKDYIKWPIYCVPFMPLKESIFHEQLLYFMFFFSWDFLAFRLRSNFSFPYDYYVFTRYTQCVPFNWSNEINV